MLVYKGDWHMEAVRGISRAFQAENKLEAGHNQEALNLAEEAVQLSPGNLFTDWSLGDVAAANGKRMRPARPIEQPKRRHRNWMTSGERTI